MNRLFLIVFAIYFSITPALSLDYDFSSTKKLPIIMNIVEPISTKKTLREGQNIKFKVKENLYYKNKLLVKKGSIIDAKLEMIVTRGMNGFPAEIIIDDFKIPNIKKSQLISTYSKVGQNRSLIVYPIKWALTWIPLVGSLTNLIKGGHAKISEKDTITIYYYPEWK